MNTRVQGLNPAIEDFGIICELRDLAHRNLFATQKFGRAASGNDVHATFLQRTRKRCDASLIGDGNQSARDFHENVEAVFRFIASSLYLDRVSDPRSHALPSDTAPGSSRLFRRTPC